MLNLGAIPIVAFASFVKGTLGMGFPLVATPLLSNFMDVKTVILALTIPNLLLNLVQAYIQGRNLPTMVRYLKLSFFFFIGIIAGALLLANLRKETIQLVLSLLILGFATLHIVNPTFAISPRVERLISPAVGFMAGIVGGSTSISGPILAIYLVSLKIDKIAFVSIISFLFTMQSGVQIASFAFLGLYDYQILGYAIIFVGALALGFPFGLWLQYRIPDTVFRRLVVIVLCISSLNILRKAILG